MTTNGSLPRQSEAAAPAPDAALEGSLMSDLNMLVATGGKERDALQWRALLAEAGFPPPTITPVPGDLISIVAASL